MRGGGRREAENDHFSSISLVQNAAGAVCYLLMRAEVTGSLVPVSGGTQNVGRVESAGSGQSIQWTRSPPGPAQPPHLGPATRLLLIIIPI